MSKNHDAIPIPAAEIYARPVGKLQYTCPNCGQAHPFASVAWRRLDLQCSRCHVKFQLGLGFSRSRGADAYLMGKWNSYIANHIDPHGTPYDGAKLYGTIEWGCPDCSTPQRSFANFDGLISCSGCSSDFYISVLFYRLPKVSRLKLKAPFDSIVKGLNHAPTAPIQSTPSSTPNPRPRTPSRRTRGDSNLCPR